MLFATVVFPSAAANVPSPKFTFCQQEHRLWTRYETAYCPNQSGQRAQAEWAMDRCSKRDFDHGIAEMTRLLKRDLIPLPRVELGEVPASGRDDRAP
jgi:hypothetical protein